MSIHPTLKVPALTDSAFVEGRCQQPTAGWPRLRSRFSQRRLRGGFTLVELLIVITIIGVLVGLLVPAAAMVRKSVQQAAIAMEVQALANAIEQYKNKYGEYPPDGSSSAVFQRHCRKAWPNMAPSELRLFGEVVGGVPVANSAGGGISVMDPPEALVFFLGGFSADETHPFTGPGGPLFLTNNGAQVNSSSAHNGVQYNPDRNEPLYDFRQGQLTIAANAAGTLTLSVDEANLFGGANDCLPVYLSGGQRQAPFVYFDSRTYRVALGGNNFYYNAYAPTAVPDIGVARPYKSSEVNTTVSASVDADKHYRYMNERGFQLISAGLDDSYGGLLSTNAGNDFTVPPIFFVYPTGQQLSLSTGPMASTGRYVEASGIPSTQLDNATNFSDGILENALD